MRRVVRADSPEVVRVADASPCSAAESVFRELDDAFLQTQARIWLGEVLHVRFDEETSIADLLADGELLFQVSKVIWKMLLRKQTELKHSKVHIYERTSFGKSDGRYMPYPKVDSFLKVCQILGLTGIDLFSPSDVVEKRDVRRVCMCIRSLSKKTRLKNLDVPDFDSVTYTIAMPTDLVGGICRNLEQSQCSSSSSTGYDACVDSREIYRQRSFTGDHSRLYDSCLDYDEAESSLKEFEFQSPKSDVSYDVAKPTPMPGNISSGRNSTFDGSGSELHSDEVIVERAVLFEETSNGFVHMTEAHDGEPSWSNSTRSLNIAHTEVPPKPRVMSVEENKDNNDNSTQRSGDNHNDEDISILGKWISLQPRTSDVSRNSMDDGDFVQSVHSNCEGLIDEVKRHSRDKIVDTKVSCIPSLNASGDKLDSNLYESEVHHVKKVGEIEDELEISLNKHTTTFSEKAINSKLYIMDADEDISLFTPRKTSSTAGTDATYRRSICESESSEVFDLSLLEGTAYDHEELHLYVETEMWDFLGCLSSTAGCHEMLLGTSDRLQLYGDVYDVPHPESSFIKKDFMLPNHFESPSNRGSGQSTDRSSTCTTVSDDIVENDGTTVSDDCAEKCDLSVNVSFYPITGTSEEPKNLIIDSTIPIKNVSSANLQAGQVESLESLDTLEAASSLNLTNNGLPVGQENDDRGFVMHCSSTSSGFNGVESQIVPLECNTGTGVRLENKVATEIGAYSHLYDRNNDLVMEEVENFREKLSKEDVFGQNTNTCLPLTEKDGKDDDCDSFRVKKSYHEEESTELMSPNLPLVGDAFTSMEYKRADETEKEKDVETGEGVTELAKIKGLDEEKDGDGAATAGEAKKSGKKVLTSVAGGISLVGALFLFLQLRKKRGREGNSSIVVPVHTQTPSQEGAAKKRVEIGNNGGFYPAERFGF